MPEVAESSLTEADEDLFWADGLAAFVLEGLSRAKCAQAGDARAPSGDSSEATAARILVLGTGTEIGKTHVSVRLLRALAGSGARALGVKPVESGLSELASGQADYERLGAAGITTAVPRYGLPEPLSPHLAARRAGRALELSEIVRWLEELERAHAPSLTLVETAGGAFSPLSDTAVNADLISALEPSLVLLVAPDRLGVLHDVGAALRALSGYVVSARGARAAPQPSAVETGARDEGSVGPTCGSRAGAQNKRGTPVHAVVLSRPIRDASTGTNGAELQRAVLPQFSGPNGASLALFCAPRDPS